MRFLLVSLLLLALLSVSSRSVVDAYVVVARSGTRTGGRRTWQGTRAATTRLHLSRSEQQQQSLSTNDHHETSRRHVLQRATAAGAAALGSNAGVLWPRRAGAAENEASATTETAAVAAESPVPTVRLGKGSLEVSRTIQGYWQLAGGHGVYREADAIDNMRLHYQAGITTLDSADIYGPSELIMGKFVGNQPGAIPCTKFCCFRYLEDINRDEVKLRIQRACERLQVQKLPLVQFFWSNYDVKRCVA